MALPTRLKSAREVGSDLTSTNPTKLGQLEQALCDLLGITIDTDYAAPIVGASRVAYSLVNDSAALTNLSGWQTFNKTYSILANSLHVGDVIRVSLAAEFVNWNAGDGMRLAARLGGGAAGSSSISSMNLATTGAATLLAVVQGAAVVRSLGVSGLFQVIEGFPSALYINPFPQASYRTQTLDTTAAILVSSDAQFPVTPNAADSLKLVGMVVEIMSAASTS